MKIAIFLLTVFLSTTVLSQQKSYNPLRTQHKQYRLFSNYFLDEDAGVAYATWLKQSQNGLSRISRRSKRIKIPLEQFKKSQQWAKYIFKVKREEDDMDRYGSAIYLGDNLFLTNLHVLSLDMNENTGCNRARLSSEGNGLNLSLSCKEVLACSEKLDFCLLKVKAGKYSNLSKIKKPSLVLNPNLGKKEVVTAIGNPMGFGIYASSGYGLSDVKIDSFAKSFLMKFYAPVYQGNSGGGILNSDGKIIGLVRSRSRLIGSNTSYSIAVKFNAIKEVLTEKIEDKNILKSISFEELVHE